MHTYPSLCRLGKKIQQITQTMNPENTAFVHGIKFNPKGVIASRISQYSTIIDVLGIDTVEQRAQKVAKFLEYNPGIKNLVGHSAGAYVILTLIKSGLYMAMNNIVLLNPAPLPGVKFSIFDPMVKVVLMQGLRKMIGVRESSASMRSDAKKLLYPLNDEQLDAIDDGDIPDSEIFLKRLALNQFARPWGLIHPPEGSNMTVVNAADDQLLGGTWKKTEGFFTPKVRRINITGGHMGALIRFEETILRALT